MKLRLAVPLTLMGLMFCLIGLIPISMLQGCASLPVKQTTALSLQASETALESAHNIERSYCFNIPATEVGLRCTNPLAVTVKLCTAAEMAAGPCARHRDATQFFSNAFDVEGKSATALIAWKAGDPAPTDVAGYSTNINAILTLAKTLDPSASTFLSQAQAAVDQATATLKLVGVK